MDFYTKEITSVENLISEVRGRTDLDPEVKAEIIENYLFELHTIRHVKFVDVMTKGF
jgi:hypothetical protein